jgi:hypothetical protein
MKISPELSNKIQKVIDEFVSDSELFLVASNENPEIKINLREIASELSVLPVLFDWFECWGIQPNGSILLFKYEKPYKIKTETNQKIINVVFHDAGKKYTDLQELIPCRTNESVTCPSCDGTGILKEFADNEFLAKSIRCGCGSIGWLPSSDPKYRYW